MIVLQHSPCLSNPQLAQQRVPVARWSSQPPLRLEVILSPATLFLYSFLEIFVLRESSLDYLVLLVVSSQVTAGFPQPFYCPVSQFYADFLATCSRHFPPCLLLVVSQQFSLTTVVSAHFVY